ncbi:hypothetical protein DFH27DRAFT_521368 [Peziza echinospora]|nr:hypothetical protein DFH27DRAFT_521368 [Peziza echinospora]
MASRTDSIPSAKLQRLAVHIHTVLKHKKRSDSEHLLFTECVGIMDLIPPSVRDSLSWNRSTRSSSLEPSLDQSTVKSFRAERKLFFDTASFKRPKHHKNEEKPPSDSLIVVLPVALEITSQPNIDGSPSSPQEFQHQQLQIDGRQPTLLLENSTHLDESTYSCEVANALTALRSSNQRHSCPPDSHLHRQIEGPTCRQIEGPPSATVLDTPRYASEPTDLQIEHTHLTEAHRPSTPPTNISDMLRRQTSTLLPTLETIQEIPGSFVEDRPSVPPATPRMAPPKPQKPVHMRMVGLRSPGEEHLPLAEVLKKFGGPTGDASSLSTLTGTSMSAMLSTSPPRQAFSDTRHAAHSMPTKRLKRARSKTVDGVTSTAHGANRICSSSSNTTSTTKPSKSPDTQKNNTDVLQMTPEEMTRLVAETVAKSVAEALGPINTKLDALPRAQTPANQPPIPEILKQARLEELASQTRRIEAEMAAVRNNTWVAPDNGQNQQTRVEPRDPNTPRPYHLRFDPTALPKYTQPGDLESWLAEMQLEVNTFGETVVCPAIYRHCFKSGDPVKSWYTMLGPDKADDLTKGPGCWFRFASAMREVWSKSIAARQREAEDRYKLPTESFIQYYFQKLKLLQASFPESAHSTHISRIRARFNDAQADRFIREQQDLLVFSEQCRQYDDHLKLHPVNQRITQFTFPSGSSGRYRTSATSLDTRAATAPPQSAPPSTTAPRPTRETNSAAPQPRPRDSGTKRRPDARLATVSERINPATGKMERSFTRLDGTVKYLERSCDFCAQMGKENQQHFSFECPLKGTAKTLLAHGSDSDSDIDLPGVRSTPNTMGRTSYTFSASSSGSEN